MTQTIKCPFCAETIEASSIKCEFCGESINVSGQTHAKIDWTKHFTKLKNGLKTFFKYFFILLVLKVVSQVLTNYNSYDSSKSIQETKGLINTVFNSTGSNLVDDSGNFNTGIYDKINQANVTTLDSQKTKNSLLKMTKNEEDFLNKINALGELSIESSDYHNIQKIRELIGKFQKYRQFGYEYKVNIANLMEESLGRKLNIINPKPYTPDEKLMKVNTLIKTMSHFADTSIELYGYLIEINSEIEFDSDGNPAIEDDYIRNKFNNLIEEQGKAANDLTSESNAIEQYNKDYIQHFNTITNQ